MRERLEFLAPLHVLQIHLIVRPVHRATRRGSSSRRVASSSPSPPFIHFHSFIIASCRGRGGGLRTMCIGFFSHHRVIEVYTIEFDTPSSCASMASLARIDHRPDRWRGVSACGA
jgi:hypothetical protein